MKNKIKTKKAAAKRFKVSKKGNITRYKSGMRHLLEHKSSNKKRQSRQKQNEQSVKKADIGRVKRMLVRC